ncbi:MAG: hypothetical protein ACRDAU_07925 [Clostridium sp.]
MRTKKIMRIIAIVAMTSFTLTPSLTSFAEGVNTNTVNVANLNVKNTMKDSVLNIYNSSSKLTGTINFSSITKKMNITSENMNETLGNGDNNQFIQLSLYKPGQEFPYKEIQVSGNETGAQLNEALKNVSFNYGDYLSLFVQQSIGNVKSSNVKNESGKVQNYVITQNGLKAYGEANTSSNVNSKDNWLSIYNSNNKLTGNVNFSTKTKQIQIVGANQNEALGNNENSQFIQLSLYKSGQELPYKEIQVNGNETANEVNKELKNVTFNYGDYLSLYVHTNMGTVKANDIKNKNGAVQSYVITENGLKVYVDKESKGTTKDTNPQNKKTVKKETPKTSEKPFKGLIINPLKVYSTNFLTTEIVLTGRTEPNVTVNINCQNTSGLIVGKSNAEGYFSIPIKEKVGTSFNTVQPFDIFTSKGWTILQQTNVYCLPTNDNPEFVINKVNVDKSKSDIVNITGTVFKNQEVTVNVDGKTFEGKADSNGNFSIPTINENKLNMNTPIEVSINANLDGTQSVISKKVYPIMKMQSNIEKETNSGIKYVLNGNANYLTSPFNSQIYYAKQHLPSNVYNAWYKAFSTLLKYNNSGNKYKLNSDGEARIFVYYGNTGLTPAELPEILNYLTQLPRMYSVEWKYDYAVNGQGKIMGQYFFIKPAEAKGDTYQKQLLAMEPTVTRILSNIKPDMDEYQVIGEIENQYIKTLKYYNNYKYTTSESIIGALEQHQAVCGGFAEGFQYLLERVGIENISIGGESFVDGVGHEWNNVDVYGKWYVSDTTWAQTYDNPGEWYLNGKDDPQEIGAHLTQDTYNGVPILQKHGIDYNTVMEGKKYVNLMGDTNYKINSNGTVTITYNDKTKEDRSVQLNLNTKGWKSETMKNEGNGVWTATVPYKKGENLAFYFTINNTYGTAGNVKTNNLKTEIFTDGINAVSI